MSSQEAVAPPEVVVQPAEPVAVDKELAIDVASGHDAIQESDRNSLSPDGDGFALPARVEQLRLLSAHGHGSSEEDISGYGSSEPEDGEQLTADMLEPDEATAKKIATIVEEYFNNDNLLFDTFLLKHVVKQREGYVNLKLVTSFKRLKKLTKDYRQVAYALRQYSTKMEVNAEGKRVRRKEPLPDYRDTPHGRAGLLIYLPEDNLELASSLVEGCGKVECIRLLSPGKQIPPDVRKITGKRPDLESTNCAFAHFWHFSSVEMLIAKQDQPDWPSNVRVERIRDPRLSSQPGTPNTRRSGSSLSPKSNDASSDFRRRAGSHEKPRSRTGTLDSSDGEHSDGRRRPVGSSHSNSRAHINGNWREPDTDVVEKDRMVSGTSPSTSPLVSPRASPRPGRRNGKHGRSPLAQSGLDSRSGGNSPAVERRAAAAPTHAYRSTPHESFTIRQPLAPDSRPAFGRGQPLVSAFPNV